MRAFAFLICAGLVCAAGVAPAQEETRVLGLAESRRLAIEQNFRFQAARLGPTISEAALTSALGSFFDPALTGSVFSSHRETPSQFVETIDTTGKVIVVPRGVPATNAFTAAIGIDKTFAFGTSVGVSAANSWSRRAGSTSVNTDLSVDVRQPLLRGFGPDATLTQIRIARTNLDAERAGTVADAQGVVRSVETAYWALVFSRESLRVSRLSEAEARGLLERSRARAETGAQAANEILQAEAALASATQQIIAREAAVRNAEDRLKQLTNLVNRPAGWALHIEPSDTPMVAAALVPVDTLVGRALRNRPDLIEARLRLEAQEWTLRARGNALRPRLDAVGSLTLSDGDTAFARSFNNIATADYPSWRAGLELSIPLGNRAAEGNYRQTLLAIRQADLNLRALQQDVEADVRIAARDVAATREQIAAARVTVRLRAANLDNEKERLRLGLTTNYDVLQFERELANSREALLRAQIDHQEALLDLEEATGLLLRSRGIIVEGTPE